MSAVEWVSVASALFSAAAAGGSWGAARAANRISLVANELTLSANDIARTMERIERDRRQQEMVPDIKAEIVPDGDRPDGDWSLRVELLGPVTLGELRQVNLIIQDEPGVSRPVPGVLVAPFRFAQGHADGRMASTVLCLGIPQFIPLDPPAGTNDAASGVIRVKLGTEPTLRLAAVCVNPKFDPWLVLLRVPVPAAEGNLSAGTQRRR